MMSWWITALIFCAGFTAGFCIRLRPRKKQEVSIPAETFAYMVERDNELMNLQKREGQKLRVTGKTVIRNINPVAPGKDSLVNN